jgi:transcription elongation factor Elf1
MEKTKQKTDPEWTGLYTCPGCGHAGESDEFDCGGAAIRCLLCNRCNAHFDSVTGKIVPVKLTGETGVLFS